MCLPNVIPARVEPQVRVAVLLAVLFAVVQHPFQHVWDRAVVSAAIACRQHHDVSVPRRPRVAGHALGVLGYAEVPFWLRLEVARLRLVVVGGDGRDGLARVVVAVVVDGHVAVELEEDDEDGKEGYRDYDGPKRDEAG